MNELIYSSKSVVCWSTMEGRSAPYEKDNSMLHVSTQTRANPGFLTLSRWSPSKAEYFQRADLDYSTKEAACL